MGLPLLPASVQLELQVIKSQSVPPTPVADLICQRKFAPPPKVRSLMPRFAVVVAFVPGETVALELGQARRAWVQVVRGTLRLGEDIVLGEGDAAGLAERDELSLHAQSECEALVFDLP